MDTKYFLLSKTIIGAILTMIGALGLPKYIAPEEAIGILDASFQITGMILVVIGRIKAKQPLGFRR